MMAFVRSLNVSHRIALTLSEFIKIINDLASSLESNEQIAELICTMSFKATNATTLSVVDSREHAVNDTEHTSTNKF